MGKVMTIGIAGGTGSGKTTITRRLLQRFPESVSVVYHDNYYKAHDDMTYEQRSHLNYDCPDAFDTELLLRDLAALRRELEGKCFALRLRDETRLRRDVWARAGEDTLRGNFLRILKERLDAAESDGERELIDRAARWGLAALDGREEAEPLW